MASQAVPKPQVTKGKGYGLLYSLYMHATAVSMRTMLKLVMGRSKKAFDKVIYIDSPGLGTGKARVGICFPQRQVVKGVESQPLPLLLVLEGGGFMIGQPEDGELHCRKLSDSVSTNVIYFLGWTLA